MPPVEFDKPPRAPIETNEDNTVREQVLDPIQDGRSGTILRDEAGNLVYPSIVPPDVESPEVPAQAPSQTPVPPLSARPKTKTDPLPQPRSGDPKPLRSNRPHLDKKFLTDLPSRRARLPPGLRKIQRADTNIPELDMTHAFAHDETSSASTTEDEYDQDDAGGNKSKKKERERQNLRDLERRFRRFRVANENYKTKGKISKDGRLNITVNDTSNTGYLAKALGMVVSKVTRERGDNDDAKPQESQALPRLSSASTTVSHKFRRPKLNIVIMVIGSRGDAQPFLKIGKVLKEEYGHRVRIATHPAFRDFVEKDSGLEFFSVGGDPSELMAFMVKNPGMIPKLETVKAGDIGRRRAAMAEMFGGFWRACINATDNERDTRNLKMMGEKPPFVADAIIANPPSFAHIHCAEALGIPLHLMFTFPYTPTQAFPHPLATIKKSNVDPGYTNFMSYPLVEMMIWQGLGDLVNDFRIKTLGLDPVSTLWAPGSTYRLHVPFTYLWSPGLIPKPEDWGEEVDVSGFVFLDLASSFKPPEDLVEFLDAGDEPIYIGFGSIVVEDADRFTNMIFEAVRLAGVRALVSKGWGGLGLGEDDVPDNIYMLENTPHDWLFPRVKACVIHGGAGTTAIALKCGKPTMVVPFFGDQYFWGSMIGSAGAGPAPVPYKKLTAESLADGIKFCLTDEARSEAEKIARSIELEGDGAKNAVRSFHSHLCLDGEGSMRCSMLPDRVAVWKINNTTLRLSALAADILVDEGLMNWKNLRPIRHKEWNDFIGPGEPLTGVAGSLVGTVGDLLSGIGSVPYRLAKLGNRRAERKRRREERRRNHQREREQSKKHPVQNPAAPPDTITPSFPFPTQVDSEHQPMTVSTEPAYQTKLSPSRYDRRCNTRTPTGTTAATTPGTAGLTDNPQEEYFNEITEGVGKSGRALAHAPVDLMLALVQGFHNAPRLYGDDTVRPPTRVTGIRSGLRAARHELVYGVYDGVTGLVRLPVRGAREGGVRGALGGFVMGITGFVLKDMAALIGPLGYTLKGIAKQIERSGGTMEKTRRLIRRARILQAQREMTALTVSRDDRNEEDHQNIDQEGERERITAEVLEGWDVLGNLAAKLHTESGRRGLRAWFSCYRPRRHPQETSPAAEDAAVEATTTNSRDRRKERREKKSSTLAKLAATSAGANARLFESVEVARNAIDALDRGEDPGRVVDGGVAAAAEGVSSEGDDAEVRTVGPTSDDSAAQLFTRGAETDTDTGTERTEAVLGTGKTDV